MHHPPIPPVPEPPRTVPGTEETRACDCQSRAIYRLTDGRWLGFVSYWRNGREAFHTFDTHPAARGWLAEVHGAGACPAPRIARGHPRPHLPRKRPA